MSIHDRDWYKELMREREGRSRPKPLVRYVPMHPMTLVGKAIVTAIALIAAAAAWHHWR